MMKPDSQNASLKHHQHHARSPNDVSQRVPAQAHWFKFVRRVALEASRLRKRADWDQGEVMEIEANRQTPKGRRPEAGAQGTECAVSPNR
jgi:hypothetical protein